MKKSIFTFCILLFSLAAFSQVSDSLALVQLKQKVGQLQTELKNQKSDFSAQIDTLQAQVKVLSTQSQQNVNTLGVRITDTRTTAEQQIADVDELLGKTILWAIIGILLAIIISGILYWLLRKKQHSDKTDIFEQLNKTKMEVAEQLGNTKTDVLKQLNSTKADVIEQLGKTKSSIEGNLAKELSKQTELIDTLKKDLSVKKKTQQPKKQSDK